MPRRSLDPRSLLSAADRHTRRLVLAHALASGTPLHPDAATVAVAAKRWRPEPFGYFDEETVAELLWVDMLAWCEAINTELPLDAGGALWHLISVLDSEGWIASHSAPVKRLLRLLQSQGGRL